MGHAKHSRARHRLKNYLDYLEVKRITGDSVWIAVYEEDTNVLLGAEIGTLGDPRIGTWLGKRIANWPRDRFREMTRFPGSAPDAAC